MRVPPKPSPVAKPLWMIADSAYDVFDWHDHLLAESSYQLLRTAREKLTA